MNESNRTSTVHWFHYVTQYAFAKKQIENSSIKSKQNRWSNFAAHLLYCEKYQIKTSTNNAKQNRKITEKNVNKIELKNFFCSVSIDWLHIINCFVCVSKCNRCALNCMWPIPKIHNNYAINSHWIGCFRYGIVPRNNF